MNSYLISIALLLLFLPTHFSADISINCGSAGRTSARNGREWVGDVIRSRFFSTSAVLQIQGSSTTSTVQKKLVSADPIPHKTARVSRSQFSYSFQVSPGQKILRLHFNPSPYKGFKGLKDLFTVEACAFTLLRNFSASLTANSLGMTSFSKEFYLYIQEKQQLNITFSPDETSDQSLDMYAFINGIEIISVPGSVSYFQGGEYVHHHTALELIHRLNIKHSSLSGDFDDSLPLWAFRKAKKVKNETWKIPVHMGFRFMIRLHFSEIGLKIAGTRDVVFKVLINEMIAYTNIDIVKERDGENKIASYKDYMVMMRGHGKEGKHDLSISVHSYDDLIDVQGLLAGFEVFKLNNPADNSLDSPNSIPLARDSQSNTLHILISVLGRRNVVSFVAVTIISLISIIVHTLMELWEANRAEEKKKPSARAGRLCRRFSLFEIQLATTNFSDALFIGKGGFGIVYKGLIDGGNTSVAVKRLKSNSMQGVNEFLMEIKTLSELRHINLVSLIGYCNENSEMILVYDFMAGGTLDKHLDKVLSKESNNCPSLTWNQRLNICIGAARGLDYLHTGHGVIHRDVKTSNILLDENFVAKVSDFGLAKYEDRSNLLQSHVSTTVKGTRGYLDPHYLHTHKLTRKSDVYAFGVVLFEILCGRPAVDLSVAEDEHILIIWARDKINRGEVDQIVASSLRERISPASLTVFVGIAERCLREDPKNRPTMSQVVQQLEFTLDQHVRGQVLVSNQVISSFDDVRPSGNDENNVFVSTMLPIIVCTDVQHHKEHTNSNDKVVDAQFPSSRKERRRATMHKPSRHWPWDAFKNRDKSQRINDLLLSEISEEILEAKMNLTKFDWDMIATATNEFSSSTKAGRDAFGQVYKAVLPTGQAVAVKRLSSDSVQGHKEFKNELLLLPDLQHRNIIKLLGYCIGRDELLTVYEFIENASLDTFIRARSQHMQWPLRFKILMEIAQGIIYLHRDSGLGVIQMNLNTSHVLLDSAMNPKISNFMFAKTLKGHRSEMETSIIGGIFGYHAPEYVLNGEYSFKTDVYNFGVIVLEVVSGLRKAMPPLDQAWHLWSKGKALDLVDESLEGAFPEDEALRCIQVGLLCTHNHPNDRPAMPFVLKMLEGEEPLVLPRLSSWPWKEMSIRYND